MNKVSRSISFSPCLCQQPRSKWNSHFYHTDSLLWARNHWDTGSLCDRPLVQKQSTSRLPGCNSLGKLTEGLHTVLCLQHACLAECLADWLADCRISCCPADSMVQGWSWTTDYSSGQEMLCFCGPKGTAQCSQQPATEHYYTQKSLDGCCMPNGALSTCRVRTSHLPHTFVFIHRRFSGSQPKLLCMRNWGDSAMNTMTRGDNNLSYWASWFNQYRTQFVPEWWPVRISAGTLYWPTSFVVLLSPSDKCYDSTSNLDTTTFF
jgi:hypothetical protein